MQPIIVEVAAASELENAVAEVSRRRAQALIVGNDGLFYSNRVLLMRTALRHALPTIVSDRELLEAGGLLSLAVDRRRQMANFAYFLNKILRGSKPADLPVQQPTKFVLSINLKPQRHSTWRSRKRCCSGRTRLSNKRWRPDRYRDGVGSLRSSSRSIHHGQIRSCARAVCPDAWCAPAHVWLVRRREHRSLTRRKPRRSGACISALNRLLPAARKAESGETEGE